MVHHTINSAKLAITNTSVKGVILDLNLANESGLELISTIRKDISEWLPIIILSGKEKSEDRITCFEAGADDCLTKPFNPIELKLRLNRLIQKYDRIK